MFNVVLTLADISVIKTALSKHFYDLQTSNMSDSEYAEYLTAKCLLNEIPTWTNPNLNSQGTEIGEFNKTGGNKESEESLRLKCDDCFYHRPCLLHFPPHNIIYPPTSDITV